MELDDIRRFALASRQFSVQLVEGPEPVHVTLTVPTRLQTSIAHVYAAANSVPANVALLKLQRALVLLAVTQWSGVRLRHVLPDQTGDEALPFDAALVELLLDTQPQWETVLTSALLARLSERKATEDTAEKN